jgi:hypothetical protein
VITENVEGRAGNGKISGEESNFRKMMNVTV